MKEWFVFIVMLPFVFVGFVSGLTYFSLGAGWLLAEDFITKLNADRFNNG